MFGYIKAFKPELKIKDFEIYKSIYCSLCKNLGENYGLLSRFLLNYDFTFLSLVSISVSGQCEGFIQKKCVFNPLKKCSFCKGSKSHFDFASACLVIMFYYKLKDDIADSKFFIKFSKLALLPFAKKLLSKAEKIYPDVADNIKQYIDKQNKIESALCFSIDEATEPSAEMLSFIFSKLTDITNEKRILERLGYLLGRFIYILDAADDLKKDFKSKNYNVFIISSKLTEYDEAKIKLLKSQATDVLTRTYYEILNTYALLDIFLYKPLIDNIITDGLLNQINILTGESRTDNERPL